MDIKSVHRVHTEKSKNMESGIKEKKEEKKDESKLNRELPPAVKFEKSQEPDSSKGDYSKMAKEAQAATEADKLRLLLDEKMEGAFYAMVQEVLEGQNIGMKAAIEKILDKRGDEITPEMIEEAQADVSEGGFYSVEAVTERILDFAKAISGDDPSKALMLKGAFEVGFEESMKIWGDDLPQISQDTYESVTKAFDEWHQSYLDEVNPPPDSENEILEE